MKILFISCVLLNLIKSEFLTINKYLISNSNIGFFYDVSGIILLIRYDTCIKKIICDNMLN